MSHRPTAAVALAGLVLALVLVHPASARAALRDAPSLALRTAHGEVLLDSLRGRVVVVDFWASWCAPCQRSFPWLNSLLEHYRDRGLVVLGVSVDKSIDDADAFLAKHPASFTVAYDPAGRAAAAFAVQGMPSTFVVGRDGRIRASHVGFDPRKTGPFEAALQEALEP
jgi:cytochrome c biogenesis protein CcmG/thiol:disulfide interchange protein DsbE